MTGTDGIGGEHRPDKVRMEAGEESAEEAEAARQLAGEPLSGELPWTIRNVIPASLPRVAASDIAAQRERLDSGPYPEDEGMRDHRPEPGDWSPEGQESGSEGYDPLAAAREDQAVIVEAARVIARALSALLQTLSPQRSPEQVQAAEQVRSAVGHLAGITVEMLGKGADQGPDLAFTAVAQAAAAKSEAKSARRRWPGAAWETVREALRKILHRLWSMIGHLVRVKEWSLQGEVSTSVLGLGSASVSVTFGS